MNIGIVTTWHEGGAGYVSRAYRDILAAHGCPVQIYARGGRYYPVGDPLWDQPDVTWGVRYMPLDKVSRFTQQYVQMIHFERWLRDHQIDIIITNEDHSVAMASRARQLGYIVGTYIDYYKKDALEQFREYDFLLCNTQRHYSVFRDFPNCLHVPWGVNLNLFRPKSSELHQGEDDTLVFFHSANFGGRNCRKGTDLLLEAFQRVTGNVKLVLHSQAPLSKFGDSAADIVRRDTRVEFIEKTVPAPGLYHRGQVFVYPSRLEGIGLCIPEALACGLPVITTNNAPMTEFVEDGVNGLLVSVQETRTRDDGYYWPEKVPDINDLTRKMQRYVDDRDLLATHRKQARKQAEDKLDWNKNASGLCRQLENIFAKMNRVRRRPHWNEKILWWFEAQYVGFLTFARRVARILLRRK